MLPYVFASVVALSAACTAQAQPLTVGEMLPHCEGALGDGPHHTMNGYCTGTIYGMGVVMTINCQERRGDGAPRFMTMQTFPSAGAGTQAFVNWARNNPNEWQSRFSWGIANALSETWPCQS